MAFVDWSQVKEVDCSKPYKTFLDLSKDDKIYLIDFKDLTIKDWKMAKSKNGSDWTFILEK